MGLSGYMYSGIRPPEQTGQVAQVLALRYLISGHLIWMPPSNRVSILANKYLSYMPYLRIRGTDYYYTDQGKGKEPLLFGHSLLFNQHIFDQQIANLSKDYRCVAFDFRGQGKSADSEGGYDLDSIAEDIAELIRYLDLAPVHFVGLSMGGMTAMRLAIRHPRLLRSMILLDTSAEAEPEENLPGYNRLIWIGRYLGLRPLTSRIIKMFFGEAIRQDSKRRHLIREHRRHFNHNRRISGTKALRGVFERQDITRELQGNPIPTLILVGEEDQLTTPDKSQRIHALLPNSEFHPIPRAAHLSSVEEPEAVNAHIRRFLQRIRNGSNKP